MHGLIHRLDQVLKAIVVMLFAMVFVASITQVFFRYILNSPFSWGEELVRFANIWCVFLAAGYGVARGAHFGIEFFIGKLPHTLQMSAQILCHLLVILLSGFLVSSGIMLVSKTLSTVSQMLQIPFGIVYLAIPVGFTLVGIFSVVELINLLKTFVNRQLQSKATQNDCSSHH